MKALILFFTLLFFAIGGNAQQHSYDFLVNTHCKAAQTIDLEKLDKQQIFAQNTKIGNEVRKVYADTIENILQHIHKENDTLTQMEGLTIFSKNYLYNIIYHCKTYLKINRKLIKSCPKETKSMQYIAIKVNQYLSKHSKFTYRQVLDSAGYMGYIYGKEIPLQLQKDYDFDIVYPNILTEYLLHKSDLFLQAWLYYQSMKLFE